MRTLYGFCELQATYGMGDANRGQTRFSFILSYVIGRVGRRWINNSVP